MPLGKPAPDGSVVAASRHYSGKPDPLGTLGVWQCPACGKQNDGQKIEHGCQHCGAGDQRQGRAGTPALSEERSETVETRFEGRPGKPDAAGASRRSDRRSAAGTPNQIDRSSESAIEVLRRIRSLIDEYLEGWMGNASPPADRPVQEPIMPPTGPIYTHDEARIATYLQTFGGNRLCYTLALALQTLAEELEGVMEPERFLTQAEALALANALMQQVPPDWTGDQIEDPPPAPVEEEQTRRASEAVSRAQAASHVAAVFRERKPDADR